MEINQADVWPGKNKDIFFPECQRRADRGESMGLMDRLV